MKFSPIAVIGHGCVLPNAFSPRQLWSIVRDSLVVISSVPDDRWRIALDRVLTTKQTWQPNTAYSDKGGYVKGFKSYFGQQGISHNRALEQLDDVFLWTLEASRQALEECKYIDKSAVLDRCGLIIGNLSYPSYSLSKIYDDFMAKKFFGAQQQFNKNYWRNRFMSGGPAMFTAQFLGLGQMSYALDAACASGIYAIKMACDELHSGRADLMIAGGVCAADTLFIHSGFSALRAMSPTGQSRPLAIAADGLVPAEGAAIVALKRLSDAISDCDDILGVIKGIALTNDGNDGGFLVPSSSSQIHCIEQAFACSEVDPRDVSYIECHATGTQIGDETEIVSLAKVFPPGSRCYLGSLKANIGHSITTSGVAGLLKVLAMMKAKTIPSLPGDYGLLSIIEDSGFRVPRHSEVWDSQHLIACVNSFGFGGNNGQMIVESWNGRNPKSGVSLPMPILQAKNKIAVVACEVRTEQINSMDEFRKALASSLFEKNTKLLDFVELDLQKILFPPSDLDKALGQQLLLLKMFVELLEKHRVDPSRTGIYIGFGINPEICRFAFRARLEDIIDSLDKPHGEEWLQRAKKAIIHPLAAEDVLGKMPNIPANRLNYQGNFKGAGFTVSAEELSGDMAWHIAVNAIVKGELSSTVVGAVELCEDALHRQSINEVIAEQKLGKAAVMIVLKEYRQAKKDGDDIIATIDPTAQQNDFHELGNDSGKSPIRKLFGYSHVADGLLHVALAIALAKHRAIMVGGQMAPSIAQDSKPYIVQNRSFLGQTKITRLASDLTENSSLFRMAFSPPTIAIYAGATKDMLLAALANDEPAPTDTPHPHRLALVGPDPEPLRLQAMQQLQSQITAEMTFPPGIYYSAEHMVGEVAFVYTGAASAYAGMGRDLLLGFPNLQQSIQSKLRHPEEYCNWIYQENSVEQNLPFFQLAGSSFFCQLHTEISRQLLGINPDAAIGMSSGETNAIFALGAWSDLDELLQEVMASGLYTQYLGGDFQSVKEYWSLPKTTKVHWENWRLLSPVSEVKQLVDNRRLYLSIINTDTDCVISGEKNACHSLIQKIGSHKAHRLHHDLAIHCPAVKPFASTWRKLHTRPTKSTSTRVYSNFLDRYYIPDVKTVAEALTGQALTTIDFPRIIKRAWQEGVRIFIEHGPKDSMTTYIKNILKEKEHVAVALDKPGDSYSNIFHIAAQLWTKGLPALNNLSCYSSAAKNEKTFKKRFLLKMPAIDFPALPPRKGAEEAKETATTKKARAQECDKAEKAFATSAKIATLQSLHQKLLDVQQSHYHTAKSSHQHFLKRFARIQEMLIARMDEHFRAQAQMPGKKYPGPSFTRQQLEILASGKISTVFGALFEQQDSHEIQCRMPEPPLLLCDRVLGIDGEPGSMGQGTIWTETDVHRDSWYLHAGHMPAGIMIESGQADLLLISWLGIDFCNKGQRAYRLLGCELCYYGGLPKAGDTLHYTIHIDGHARQGDVRLFFFHYDCMINGELRLSVRNCQAGFFTKEELRNTTGILWDPGTANYKGSPRIDQPDSRKITAKRRFTRREVVAYTEGKMAQCFGETHSFTETHTRTPRTPSGEQNFIGEIVELDISGGTAQRGYLRAKTQVHPDDWYFQGHFKNDQCMPGTLMAEAGMQVMAFYMTAIGLTIDKDGWRFQPANGIKFKFSCRGQVIPTSQEIIYELFVDDIILSGDYPTLYGHILGTVDGVKAFLGENLALQLVPGWPINNYWQLLGEIEQRDKAYDGPVAKVADIEFNYMSLIKCAIGKPSEAFGEFTKIYDSGHKRTPRLPGPPFHFITRINHLNATFGQGTPGGEIISEYEIPPHAWYFDENSQATIPNVVLMEIALQPCGWLSTASLPKKIQTKYELLFRNLDGFATKYREITPQDQKITVTTKLVSFSHVGATIIVSHAVTLTIKDQIVYKVKTAFGFFQPQLFDNQEGIKATEQEKRNLLLPDNAKIDFDQRETLPCPNLLDYLPRSRLLMLGRIVFFDPMGGPHQRGYIRAERDIHPRDWYFKAHFFQDPVQPGSLGVEGMLQLVQTYFFLKKINHYFKRPCFEPVAIGRELEWHYRGQVTPREKIVFFDADIIEEGFEQNGSYFVIATPRLWVNGLKIYQAPRVYVRMKEAE